eukprot:jgi/Ulvmu1/7597/UM038_0020.1
MARSLRIVSSLLGSFHDCRISPIASRFCHAVSDAGKKSSPLLRQLDVDMPASVNDLIPPLEPRVPQMNSLRTGLVGIKVGMVSEWDEYGVLTPFTVLWFDENQVTQVKAFPRDCTTALQIGCGSKKAKRLHPSRQAFYLKYNLPFKAKLVEFPVSQDALLPVGTRLNAAHFLPGQHVDVTAMTKDKGFQGVMKRWGFKGQDRTHGHSLSHRSLGSIGQQGYARVLPGKKMPGQMGKRRRVQLNCWVYRVDPERNLIWVQGSIHGPEGGFVMVRDARRKRTAEVDQLPFPTKIGQPGEPQQATPKKNAYDTFKP